MYKVFSSIWYLTATKSIYNISPLRGLTKINLKYTNSDREGLQWPDFESSPKLSPPKHTMNRKAIKLHIIHVCSTTRRQKNKYHDLQMTCSIRVPTAYHFKLVNVDN